MIRNSLLIASALMLTVGASTVSAQGMMYPHIEYGVLAGVNFANLRGDNADGLDSRTGFIGGLSADYRLPKHFGVELDVLYSQQGAKEDFQSQEVAASENETLKLDYIAVPLLLKYSFPTRSPLRPFVEVGPQIAFKIKCSADFEGSTTDCDANGGTDAKTVDFSGTVGAGVGFKFGKEEVSLTGRYTHGFTNIFDDVDGKNKVFSILAGFAF